MGIERHPDVEKEQNVLFHAAHVKAGKGLPAAMPRQWTEGELRPEQVGAARFLLGWSQTDLAQAAGVARSTVTHFENATRPSFPNVRAALRRALEGAGIEFVFAKDGGFGVLLSGKAADAKP